MRWMMVAIGLLAMLAAGCEGITTRPEPPVPNLFAETPEAALRRLEWTWTNRDTVVYPRLFTSDYVFAFSALDSAGVAWRTTPWGRLQEMQWWAHLVGGGVADQPAAASVVLQLDPTFTRVADPRPGHTDPRFHCAIRTRLALNVLDVNGSGMNVSGHWLFFFVRGDSAAIPDEVRPLLTVPDSTLWFIDRWEDETHAPGSSGTARAMPSRALSIGTLKARYL